jgi:hypothetical protein
MPRRSTAFMIPLLLTLVVLAACDDKDSKDAKKASPSGNNASTSADAANLRKNDPCRLLTSGEVEAVVGPLAGPPYRAAGATPQPNGEDCRYEASDRRSIRVNVTWEGGAQLIGMMGAMESMVKTAGLSELKLSDGSTIAGEWDQAHVNQCCEFNALRGDRVVTVDVAGSHATIAQAASLADAAMKRLDHPLETDGSAGIKPAQERAAQRPKPRSVCELVTRADAEAIAGVSLLAPPKGNEDSCTYAWPVDSNGSSYGIKLMVQWQDGFHEMRLTSSMVGQASSMIGIGKATPVRNEGPWDEFSQSIVGVMAVKSDVLVSVESGPYRQDITRAFVEKAVVNLTK